MTRRLTPPCPAGAIHYEHRASLPLDMSHRCEPDRNPATDAVPFVVTAPAAGTALRDARSGSSGGAAS